MSTRAATHAARTGRSSGAERISVHDLVPGPQVRVDGLCEEHVQRLMEVLDDLPPILVDRATLTVVDGRHRLRAAENRGDGKDLLVMAVRANRAHGLPLTLADRKAAAVQLLEAGPDLSDRRIAYDAGLSPGTVAALRACTTTQVRRLNTPQERSLRRIGLDGRVRPLSAEPGKQAARELLTARPDLSLRDVARQAGISVGTAHYVRNQLLREGAVSPPEPTGSDEVASGPGRPVTPAVAAVRRTDTTAGPLRTGPRPMNPHDPNVVLARLLRDPALCRSEAGREVLARLRALVLAPQDRDRISQAVPSHQLSETIAMVRQCARFWIQVADRLEDRLDGA